MSNQSLFKPCNAKEARSSIKRNIEFIKEPYKERSLNTCFGTPIVPDSTKGFHSVFKKSNYSPKPNESAQFSLNSS